MQERERLRIAIVGLRFGEHVADWITQEPACRYFEVAAVCDRDGEKNRRVAERLGVPAFEDIEAILDKSDIPVIGLFTPPNGRAGLLRRILLAGRDVITTKPFELDPEAALDVLELARELGRVIHLNSPAPLPTGEIQQIWRWARSYDLGRIVSCRAETWADYNEQADNNWYDDPRLCPAAPLLRLGIYLVNDLLWLLGPPRGVHVASSRLRTGRPTADNAAMTLNYESGALATVFASFCIGDGQPYKDALTVNFERGTVYHNAAPRYSLNSTWMTLVATREGKPLPTETIEVPDRSGSYQWELAWRAMHGERLEGQVNPEQIVDGIRILNAMARSEESGGVEALR